MSFCKSMDKLPKWAKIVLALPILDIIWSIYRLIKSASKNNIVGIVLAILCIIPGAVFVWVIDLITTILYDKVLWID